MYYNHLTSASPSSTTTTPVGTFSGHVTFFTTFEAGWKSISAIVHTVSIKVIQTQYQSKNISSQFPPHLHTISYIYTVQGYKARHMEKFYCTDKLLENKSCQKPTIQLAGRLREKLNISPMDIGHE